MEVLSDSQILCSEGGGLTGETICRARFIQSEGYDVVYVMSSKWEVMPDAERITFLKEILGERFGWVLEAGG